MATNLGVNRRMTMGKFALYIEKREQGDFAVRRPGSEKASAICTTKAKAIERAREISRDARIYVERDRDISVGGRDRWRLIGA